VRVASTPPAVETAEAESAVSRAPATRSVATTREVAPPRSSHAPLSLAPNAEPARPAPVRTASAPAHASAAPAAHGAYVQISSQRSEADAQASFRSLQSKFPEQLGNRQAHIRRADLGSKGTYYRAMVGPFASSGEASEFCGGLKAAGGQCIVSRN
jgi:hypothetical protein